MIARIRLALLLLLVSCAAPAQTPRVRISAWYWLNSAPKEEWQRDFRNMAHLGFTDVVLCWGLDAAAFGLRIEDTRAAMRWAHDAGMGAYIMLWHPEHNSLPRRPEFVQVDSGGHRRFTFDVFNPQWRATQWKEYLQRVARAYRGEPAMAGYVFDDSFGVGSIGSFASGIRATPADRYISYGEVERRMFGGDPPRKPEDPGWSKWCEARAGWWDDWARDTVKFIREIDPDPRHEIYLEDEAHVLNPVMRDTVGLDFGRLAKHFDAMGAYTAVAWEGPDAGASVARKTRDVLARTRAALGPDKKIIYTFWVANLAEERSPGPARFPTVEQIRQIADAALAAGIRHLDLYGYRIGDWVVKPVANWPKARPGTGSTYPLTGQFPQKFLWDRPQLHEALGAYLRGLNSKR